MHCYDAIYLTGSYLTYIHYYRWFADDQIKLVRNRIDIDRNKLETIVNSKLALEHLHRNPLTIQRSCNELQRKILHSTIEM